jgi:hypothetical protein
VSVLTDSIFTMKASCIAALLMSTLVSHAIGQISTFTTQYTINVPLGKTRDFIDQVSFRGFTVDYKYYPNPKIAFGLSSGWYTFYEETDFDTYTASNGGTFWGKQFRYINSVPILLTVNYVFNRSETSVSPFVGLAFGSTYNRQETGMNLYRLDDDAWHFTFAPEVGLSLPIDVDLYAYVSARYNNNFEAEDVGTQSYLGFNLGVTYVY